MLLSAIIECNEYGPFYNEVLKDVKILHEFGEYNCVATTSIKENETINFDIPIPIAIEKGFYLLVAEESVTTENMVVRNVMKVFPWDTEISCIKNEMINLTKTLSLGSVKLFHCFYRNEKEHYLLFHVVLECKIDSTGLTPSLMEAEAKLNIHDIHNIYLHNIHYDSFSKAISDFEEHRKEIKWPTETEEEYKYRKDCDNSKYEENIKQMSISISNYKITQERERQSKVAQLSTLLKELYPLKYDAITSILASL